MPDRLTAEQLESVQKLVTNPLVQTVRAEMQVGHERLAGAIDKLTDRLSGHMESAAKLAVANEARINSLDHRLTAIERWASKVKGVYSIVSMIIGATVVEGIRWFFGRK